MKINSHILKNIIILFSTLFYFNSIFSNTNFNAVKINFVENCPQFFRDDNIPQFDQAANKKIKVVIIIAIRKFSHVKNAYYMFIVPNFSSPQLQGYMVRGRAVGFIKTGSSVNDVAHELGHGAFKLEHTFDGIAKGTSNNLMDYSNQTHLTKSQWLNIQNPSSELTWWDEEEDGSSVVPTTCDINVLPQGLKEFYSDALTCSNNLASRFKNYMGYSTGNISAAKTAITAFCATTRIHIIKCLINQNVVSENDEKAILDLLETTPRADVGVIRSYLALNNYSLYLQLNSEFNDAGIGQNSYTKLVEVLCNLLPKEGNAQQVDNIFNNNLIFEYDGNTNRLKGIKDLSSEDVFESNTMNNTRTFKSYTYEVDAISYTDFDLIRHYEKRTYPINSTFIQPNCSTCVDASQSIIKKLKPFDLILVQPKNAQTFNNFSLPSDLRLMPALYFKWLEDKNYNQNLENAGTAVIGAVMFATGVGELRAAVQAGEWAYEALALGEIVVGSAYMANGVSNNGFDGYLNQNLTPEQYGYYKQFEFTVNMLTLLKAGTTIVTKLKPRIIISSTNFYNSIKNSKQFLQNLKTQFPQRYQKLKEYFIKVLGRNIDDIVNNVVRQTWNGYSNIFKATVDEILEATNRIKNHRLTAPSGGNYGYIEGNVNNIAVDNKFWRSGPANLQTEPQVFTAIQVEGANGSSWLRNTDSEYKMLNKLASDLGGTTGTVKPQIIGELKIISENQYCASCAGIIQQFHNMFPNIKLVLVDGAK